MGIEIKTYSFIEVESLCRELLKFSCLCIRIISTVSAQRIILFLENRFEDL